MSSHKNPRLQFSDEERNIPALKKPIRKVDKAAAKADKAKPPQNRKPKLERTSDKGKPKVKLKFEEVDKPPPSKLSHAIKTAPGIAVKSQLHKEIRKSEQENVGVEGAHKLEEAAESGGHFVSHSVRSHKLRKHRKSATAEKRLEKANINALHKQNIHNNPQLNSNPLSRWQQKQAIKKQYAAAKRTGQATYNAASNTQKTAAAAKKVTEKAGEAAQFVYRNGKTNGIVIGIGFVLMIFLNAMSSCTLMFDGGASIVGISTYPSEDEEMLAAEDAYAAMEADMQYELDNYTSIHSGYDEYRFDLDSIGHDPYVLISILSAIHEEFTLSQVQGTLSMLFEKQYILTETVDVETRYRTETETWIDDDGVSHTRSYSVPYNYYICNVKLENFNLSHVPIYIMDEEQLGMYATYMATLGNRPDLFEGHPNAAGLGEYETYAIPPEALEDEVFAAIITEAEKYLGYPYVWGGYNPNTSFDCSGYVSWVINHSGWDVGRLGAQGLYNICTKISSSNARPGDLVFFTGTFDAGVPASHVGIYVGNGMMIHCGDPISYASIETNYWQNHLYGFGRLP